MEQENPITLAELYKVSAQKMSMICLEVIIQLTPQQKWAGKRLLLPAGVHWAIQDPACWEKHNNFHSKKPCEAKES